MRVTAERRRLILEEIATSDSVSAHERLRALELIIEQDRLEPPPKPEAPPYRETDPERLQKVFELLLRAGVFRVWLDAEVERLTAKRLREQFSVVDGSAEAVVGDGE